VNEKAWRKRKCADAIRRLKSRRRTKVEDKDENEVRTKCWQCANNKVADERKKETKSCNESEDNEREEEQKSRR
jgi:hypothetical protein